MSQLLVATQFITKVTAGIFTGKCSYCTVIEQPSRLKLPTNMAVTQWRNGFKKAAIMQSALLTVSGTSALIANYYEPNKKWLAAGLLLLSILPYTGVVMMSTNTALLDPKFDVDSDEARSLLVKWGNMHSVRTLMAYIALVLINLP